MVVYGITQANEVALLGLVEVAHEGVCGWLSKDGDEVFDRRMK